MFQWPIKAFSPVDFLTNVDGRTLELLLPKTIQPKIFLDRSTFKIQVQRIEASSLSS